MKKSILFALVFGLGTSLVIAEPPTKKGAEPKAPAASKKADDKKAEAKPAEAKKADPKPEAKKPVKKTSAKPDELSESDKALLASGKKLADTLTAAQKTNLLKTVNTGKSEDIQAIDGVGEGKAGNIIKERPHAAVEDLIMVDGIGEGTFEKIITFAKGKQKDDAPAEKAEKKPAAESKPKAPAKEEPKSGKDDKKSKKAA